MRFVAVAAGCLLLAGMATGNCSVVEVLKVQSSSQNVRIIALRDGNPLHDVKIEVFTSDERPLLSVSTNKYGVVTLPLLPPGRYHVAAAAPGGLGADLMLDVSKKKGKKTSAFSMELFVRPPQPPDLAKRITIAEETGASERLQEFRGLVEDPAGAGIRGTEIEVSQKGSLGKVQVAKTQSDTTGRFSVHLAAGAYTAVFQVAGFSTQIQIFEIAEDGAQRDLRIVLQLAPCT